LFLSTSIDRSAIRRQRANLCKRSWPRHRLLLQYERLNESNFLAPISLIVENDQYLVAAIRIPNKSTLREHHGVLAVFSDCCAAAERIGPPSEIA